MWYKSKYLYEKKKEINIEIKNSFPLFVQIDPPDRILSFISVTERFPSNGGKIKKKTLENVAPDNDRLPSNYPLL